MPGLYELIQYLEWQDMSYAIASRLHKDDILKFLRHAVLKIHPKAIVSNVFA